MALGPGTPGPWGVLPYTRPGSWCLGGSWRLPGQPATASKFAESSPGASISRTGRARRAAPGAAEYGHPYLFARKRETAELDARGEEQRPYCYITRMEWSGTTGLCLRAQSISAT